MQQRNNTLRWHLQQQGLSSEQITELYIQLIRSVVTVPPAAAATASEDPKVVTARAQILSEFSNVLSGTPSKCPPVRGDYGEARIKLIPNPKPVRKRELQLQGDRRAGMEKLLQEFIERGWMEPSNSEWASPAFVVPKKVQGEWRLVVDYRYLNTQTEYDSYGLPLIDAMLQRQVSRRMFSVLDLKHGYHQVPLAEESRDCTTMSTPLGPLRWRVMPMGVKNGNSAFQRMTEDIL